MLCGAGLRSSYKFSQGKLLQLALRHASAGTSNNAKLAWLGNSVLSLIAAYDGFSVLPGAERKGMPAHPSVRSCRYSRAIKAAHLNDFYVDVCRVFCPSHSLKFPECSKRLCFTPPPGV